MTKLKKILVKGRHVIQPAHETREQTEKRRTIMGRYKKLGKIHADLKSQVSEEISMFLEERELKPKTSEVKGLVSEAALMVTDKTKKREISWVIDPDAHSKLYKLALIRAKKKWKVE